MLPTGPCSHFFFIKGKAERHCPNIIPWHLTAVGLNWQNDAYQYIYQYI